MLFVLITFIAFGQACVSIAGGLSGSTIRFYANGGNGTVPEPIRINKDNSIVLPDSNGLYFGDATFSGWILQTEDGKQITYKPGSSFSTSRNVTLIAKWELDADNLDSVQGLANKLVWLQNNAENNGRYTINVTADEKIGPQWLYYHGKRDIVITLVGTGTNRSITYYTISEDFLFQVGRGVTLVLDNNITIRGGERQSLALVTVNGTLIMNAGSTITDNRRRSFSLSGSASSYGVSINGGNFIMNGGIISNNTQGVYIWNDSTFTMNNGTISNNSIGVDVHFNGNFILNNGTISENSVIGVEVLDKGTFNMYNGIITRNGDDSPGARSITGGVRLDQGSIFNRVGGLIYGNHPNDIFR